MNTSINLRRAFYYVIFAVLGIYFLATLLNIGGFLEDSDPRMFKSAMVINTITVLYIAKADRQFLFSTRWLRVIGLIGSSAGLALVFIYIFNSVL